VDATEGNSSMRCSNQTGRYTFCSKPIPDDDIDAVKTDKGIVCGSCVERLLFSKSDDPLDALGRPKQGKATRQSGYCGSLASTRTTNR